MTACAGVALLVALATPADAFGWQPTYYAPTPQVGQPSAMPRQARPNRTARVTRAAKEKAAPEQGATDTPKAKQAAAVDTTPKAKEPLQIVISVEKQQLTLYSGSQPIAHSRVSTGTASHPTPTGVFSVIQKDRWHRSNIYDNAPMFYMQRITWSGVAMHQGIVPNHPASHGCIRLPEAFARQLWGMTKMGVRVVVSRGQVTPVAFSHPKMFIYKQPAPIEEKQPEVAVNNAVDNGGSTDMVRQAYRAFETARGFTKPGETATDATKPGEMAFTTTARAETPLVPVPTSTSADVVKNAYHMFDMANYKRGKIMARGADPETPLDKPVDAVKPLKPGPISVFVSRKEGKLFVRKGFEPVFDMPVTIDRPDQPLGTHVFTALSFNDDNASLRWSVMTVPTNGSVAAAAKRKKGEPVQAAPTAAPSTAAAALDRVTFPQDAIDRISGLVSEGASLIISDQGLGPETGKGTDFIVLTR